VAAKNNLSPTSYMELVKHLIATIILFAALNPLMGQNICTPVDIMSPNQNLNWLNDIYFINSSIGFAVGSKATILKTVNGGQTWERSNYSGYDALKSVQFLNDSVGIATDPTHLVKTTNGGEDWIKIDPGFYPVAVGFDSNGTGFALGNNNIYRSIDQGNNWELTFSFDAQVTGDLRGMKIMSDELLYAFTDHQIYQSNDGYSWSAIADTEVEYVNRLYFITKSDWILHGISNSKGKLFRTRDGGQTWLPYSLGGDFLYNVKLHVVNESVWFMMKGDNTDSTFEDKYQLMKTVDSGETWHDVNIPNATWNRIDQAIFFASDDIGYIVNTMGGISKTVDGGENWISLTDSRTYLLQKVFFLNDSTGFVVGEAGSIQKTIDGGNNWEYIRQDQNMWFTDINFITPEIGFISSGNKLPRGRNGAILKTIDQGETWSTVLETDFRILKVAFTTEHIGIAIGDEGKILRTTDGGITWSQIFSSSSIYLRDLQMIDEQIGYISAKQLLMKTTDGGESWDIKNINSWTDSNSMFFLDKEIGFIVGDYGSYRTQDGGETFTAANVSATSMLFATSEIGYAVGGFGRLKYTDNAGQTWESINLPTSQELTDIAISSANELIIIGRAGAIFKVRAPIPYQAGMIIGNDKVCLGEEVYEVANPSGYEISWNLMEGADILVENDTAHVSWLETGVYQLQVILSSSCGFSETIAMTVESLSAPDSSPELRGMAETCVGSKLYEAELFDNMDYNWLVNGGGSLMPDNNTATMDWNNEGIYSIEVFLSNRCGNGDTTRLEVSVSDSNPETPLIELIDHGTLLSSAEFNNQWFLNGEAIEGAKGQSLFTDIEHGVFTVKTTNGCGSTFSEEFEYSIALGADDEVNDEILIYPNPTTESVGVEISTKRSIDHLEITNMSGNTVLSMPINNQQSSRISTEGLTPGIYLLQVYFDSKSIVKRLFVN
jgi:photosystem II stability/assembly factor-like uncharacterized protein